MEKRDDGDDPVETVDCTNNRGSGKPPLEKKNIYILLPMAQLVRAASQIIVA